MDPIYPFKVRYSLARRLKFLPIDDLAIKCLPASSALSTPQTLDSHMSISCHAKNHHLPQVVVVLYQEYGLGA